MNRAANHDGFLRSLGFLLMRNLKYAPGTLRSAVEFYVRIFVYCRDQRALEKKLRNASIIEPVIVDRPPGDYASK
jgi:hypothetical protein